MAPSTAFEAFPHVRPDRGKTIGPAGAPLVAPPISHAWPFLLVAGANNRSTVVSPSFPGPLFLSMLEFSGPDTASSVGGLSLFYSIEGSGRIVGGAVTLIPSGTPVFEPLDKGFFTGAQDIDEVAGDIPGVLASTAFGPHRVVLNYYVPVFDQVFLKLSARSGAGVESHWKGVLSLFSSVDPAHLPFV